MEGLSDRKWLVASNLSRPQPQDRCFQRENPCRASIRHRRLSEGGANFTAHWHRKLTDSRLKLATISGAMLCLAAGCAQLSPAGSAMLAGKWHFTGSGVQVIMHQKELRTEEPQYEAGQTVALVRTDGTIDLSSTMLGMVDGIDRLRNKGDRVSIGSGLDKASDFLQVESNIVSAKRSELVLGEHHKDEAEDIRFLFSVELISPNRLLFVAGSYGPGHSYSSFQTTVLER